MMRETFLARDVEFTTSYFPVTCSQVTVISKVFQLRIPWQFSNIFTGRTAC